MEAIWLEIFGYIGTALVVVSMMMTSLAWLRALNISGSVISAIYSALSGAWPIVVMNISLIVINAFHLIRERTRRGGGGDSGGCGRIDASAQSPADETDGASEYSAPREKFAAGD